MYEQDQSYNTSSPDFMISLGLEGSANKLGIAIMRDNEILVSVRKTFNAETGQGFLPIQISQHHRLNILKLITLALRLSKLSIRDISIICYTKGPGIGSALASVALVARIISLILQRPIVPVNHCVAHIEMGRYITGAENPVILYVSGGNTQVIAYSNKKYRIFGETIDIAVGNCIDKAARDLNISNVPSPGYNVELKARQGDKLIKLPYNVKGMDVSFSGLATNLKSLIADHSISDICFSLQETAFSMLTEITERAMSHVGSEEVLVVGGVGCNKRLQNMMESMAKSRASILHASDERFCIDNGLMIAWTGLLIYKSFPDGKYPILVEEAYCNQRYRTDEVIVSWRS